MILQNFLNSIFKSSGQGWHIVTSSSPLSKKELDEYYNGVIFACIDAIAVAVQNVDYGLYKKKGDDWDKVEDHQAIKLFKTPNIIHSDRDLLYMMSAHIDSHGQSFIYPVRSAILSKPVVELRLLDPASMSTKAGTEEIISGYKQTTNGKPISYEPDELVNILRPDPQKMITGLSTIEMARYEADNELNAQRLNASFYENGGLPSGAVTTDAALDDPSFAKIKARFKRQYTGVKNAYKVMFMTHGTKYQSIQPTQRDMEYVQQRKLNRDQIITIFRVPKSMLAISDQLNKAVSVTEYKAFMANVVEPRLKMIFEKLNRFYLPMFPGTEGMEFRFESVVGEDKEQMLKEHVQGFNKWLTRNEIRAARGLEAVDGGDDFVQESNPLDLLVDDKDDEEEDKGKKNDKCGCSTVTKVEDLPKPSDLRKKKDQEYTRRRNKYIQAKEKQLSLKLEQHIGFLIRDISKVKIGKSLTKDVLDDAELQPDKVMQEIMPENEKSEEWRVLLWLILMKSHKQAWATINKQLEEVYSMETAQVDTNSSYISNQANTVAQSVSKTIFTQIRSEIKSAVDNGFVDLREIKKQVVARLRDVKDWKADQIARTELAWTYSEAQMKAFNKSGVKNVTWVCGSGACTLCQSNCGQTVKLNSAFPSGHTNEPAHPNCRCMVLAAP